MKRICKFITIPCSLYDTPDLSLSAKWTLLALDSVCEQGGWVYVGVQALTTLTNLTNKEVKAALLELREHGAIEVKVNEDNQTLMKPLLYKDAYPKIGEKPVIVGDKPTDSDPIDYQLIQDTWNSTCDRLSRLDKFTARRKQKTRTCLKGASATLSDMIKVIRLVATSAFLNGSKTDWCASYDWIIKSPDNFTKIIEGQYHKDYGERRSYETIMNGGEVNQKQDYSEDFYR